MFIFLPPSGDSRAERWVAAARLAAASDLLLRLKKLEVAGPISVLAAEDEEAQALEALGARRIRRESASFHFGETLAAIAREQGGGALAYFGGGSAPLLSPSALSKAFHSALLAEGPFAAVNNLHSTDWAVLSETNALSRLAERLPGDNPLGWVLATEADYTVDAPAPSAETAADIDTPSDVLLLGGHSGLGDHLRSFLEDHGDDARVKALRALLGTPGRSLAVIGRASSSVWRALEQRTQIWVRMFVEERGMVASQRLARHEVRSLIADALEEWGATRFIEHLAGIADGCLWDNRVWMAARGGWPPASDRFAADLGWVDDIQDRALRDLTEAIAQAPIPILTGGYGVVSGGLFALLETLDS